MSLPSSFEEALIYFGCIFSGYVLSSVVKYVKDSRQKLKDIQLTKRLENKSQKLERFYWPVYFRLLKSYAAWKQLKRFKIFWDPDDIFAYERRVLLGIHSEIRNIINDNMCIIEPDDHMLSQILRYLNHVRLYETLRETNGGNRTFYPADFDISFPDEFSDIIKNKTLELQNQYNDMIGNEVTHNKKCCTLWCCGKKNNTNEYIIQSRLNKLGASSRNGFGNGIEIGMKIPEKYVEHTREEKSDTCSGKSRLIRFLKPLHNSHNNDDNENSDSESSDSNENFDKEIEIKIDS